MNLCTHLLLMCCVLLTTSRAWAVDTSTWSGTVSGLWDLNSNWGGNVLQSGDALVFPPNITRKATQNDFLTTLSLGPITFNGSGYVLSGNAITLAGGVILNGTGSTAEIALPMTINGSQSFAIGSSTSHLTISALIDGDGGLVKTGSGWLHLLGPQDYDGGTIVEGGVVSLGPDGPALSDVKGQIQLGAAYLSGSGTVDGIVSLGGAQVAPGNATTIGTLTSTGNVTLTGATDGLHFKVSTTQADRLNVTGLLSIRSADNLVVYLSPGIDRAINADVTLIQNDGDDDHDGVITTTATPLLVNLPNFESRHYQLSLVGGDGNDVVLRRVGTVTSTTTLESSAPGGIAHGASVTFTATVSSASGLVSGVPVIFRDGIRQLGTMNTDVFGEAQLSVSSLPAGTRSITAMSMGNGTYKPTVSAAFAQTVNGTNTTVDLTVTPETMADSPVTLTAVISPAGSPNGTMYFIDNGAVIGSKQVTSLSTELTGVPLVAGSHNLVAEFVTDGAYEYDVSDVENYVVDGTATLAFLGSNANPVQAGNPVTLLATVTGTGTPNGSVIFKNGTTTLATKTLSGGSAVFVTSGLSTGTHSLTVEYLGATDHLPSTSTVLSQVITAAPDGSGSSGGNDVELSGGCGLGSGTAALLFGLLMLLGLRLRRN